jgi:hypothetical protein
MSTFLQLVNLARSEAAVAGGDLTTLQSGLTKESQLFKSWVANEWLILQGKHPDWQFLRTTGEFNSVANQAQYTPQQAEATVDGTSATASILADWKRDSFRISTAGNSYADEAIFGFMPWDTFRNMYQYGAMRAARNKPVVFSVDPQKNIWLGATPDQAYTVGYEFYRTPQALSADADTPLMPDRFHSLVAYKALRAYGIYMSAPEVIGRADDKINELYGGLVNDQLPGIVSGPPLA